MPTYEYTCPGCGAFDAWRPATESNGPAVCPVCGASAPRRYGPPNLRITPAPLGAAIERSERSAYEPQVVTTPPRGGGPLHAGQHRSPRRPWQLG